MRRGERPGRPGWSWFTILAASIILLVAGARWYYLHEVSALEYLAFNDMADQADFVSRQVEVWRRQRLGDGQVFASAAVGDLVTRFLRSSDPENEAKLKNFLNTARSSYNYSGIALVDPSGKIRLMTGDVPQNQTRFAALRKAAGGKTTLSDLYLEPVHGKPWMSVVVPLPAGYSFFLDIDPQSFLYPYLQSRLQKTQTGETYLVRQENNYSTLDYLSPMRGRPGTELRIRRAVSGNVLPHNPAAYLNGFTIKAPDYRGHIALFNIRIVGDTNWYVVSKIDDLEVTTPLSPIRWQIVGVLLLACGLNIGIAFIAWKNHQLRLYRNRRDWFRRIASDTPAYLWTIEADGGVSFLNQQIRRFLARDSADQDRITDFISFIHPDEAQEVHLKILESLRLQTEYADEFRLRRFDGEYRLMATHALPRSDPDGIFIGLAGSSVDITERRTAEDRLREANSRIVRELQERTRSEKEVTALTSRLISAQEKERTRLARELHDDLGQQIAAASIAASNLKRKIAQYGSGAEDASGVGAEAFRLTESLRSQLVNLADWVRRLSHELHPSSLELAGLAPALKNYCAELTALTSHEVNLYIDGSFEGISPVAALCVYRVAQEALGNSAHHSGVKVTKVRLSNRNGEIHLIVADRGSGIKGSATAGLGLVSMRERTRLAGGRLDVDSWPGKGVTVSLTIPAGRAGSSPRAAGTSGANIRAIGSN